MGARRWGASLRSLLGPEGALPALQLGQLVAFRRGARPFEAGGQLLGSRDGAGLGLVHSASIESTEPRRGAPSGGRPHGPGLRSSPDRAADLPALGRGDDEDACPSAPAGAGRA